MLQLLVEERREVDVSALASVARIAGNSLA